MVKLKCHKISIEVVVEPFSEGLSWGALYHFNEFYGFSFAKRNLFVNSISEKRDNARDVLAEAVAVKVDLPAF